MSIWEEWWVRCKWILLRVHSLQQLNSNRHSHRIFLLWCLFYRGVHVVLRPMPIGKAFRLPCWPIVPSLHPMWWKRFLFLWIKLGRCCYKLPCSMPKVSGLFYDTVRFLKDVWLYHFLLSPVDRLPNVQKVSTVSHLLLVMRWIRFTVGQILMMPVLTVISHVNPATVTFALMVKGASHIHFATRLARRQCLHLL